ncbi:MAG: hypothetical protein HY519_01835 [Candidatus Aenigmarchaeota archaeon]|nr:hypothetical protein [Candidatus Aenigmarchaeota archaeon]
MVVHTIKGVTCSVKVDIPPYMDEKTKAVLLTVLKYCLEPKYRAKVMKSMNNLLSHVSVLMDWTRKVNQYDSTVEKAVRDFVGLHLNHGFLIGQKYAETEQAESGAANDEEDEDGADEAQPSGSLEHVLAEQMDYKPLLDRLDDSRKQTAVIMFYSLDLARLAIETGLMLSNYLSADLIEKHYQKLKKEIEYIG